MNLKDETIQLRKEKVLAKARLIASTHRIKRSTVNESRNIWLVGSGNPKTPNKFYCVSYDKELDSFYCECPAYSFSKDNTCKHILATSMHENKGGST